ncbi:uncharacterized protein [Spinacia oleracea]|uniref:Amino acid transporter transmembrane domain-containing protein n=1 Tax=Spinacia oleracea TaxID=3562 RepID=A0ABM3RG14_SPIOL|nr:uncharacterized protein LOC130469356 [Spinacia oleracea]
MFFLVQPYFILSQAAFTSPPHPNPWNFFPLFAIQALAMSIEDNSTNIRCGFPVTKKTYLINYTIVFMVVLSYTLVYSRLHGDSLVTAATSGKLEHFNGVFTVVISYTLVFPTSWNIPVS